MAEYVVKIADERGHTHQQVEHGYSIAEVRDRFASQGYLVHWVKPQGMLSSLSIRRGRKIKQSSFLVFNQQFLTLIKAGLPILNALDLLIKRQRDMNLRQILENVRERVKGGELLSDAFATHPAVPKIYTTTLMAGEKSGNIDEVLTRYISFQRMAMSFRKKLMVSLIYPTLLVSVVTIMVMFLFTYVVPKFAELFNSLDAKLPAITVFMLSVGVNAQKYFPLLAGVLVLGWFSVLAVAKNRSRGRSDRPRDSESAAAWRYPAETSGRDLFAHAGDFVAGRLAAGAFHGNGRLVHVQPAHSEGRGCAPACRVREGQGLAASLEEQKIFPDLAVEMLEVGESTGALPAMLNSVAEFYEEDVQTALGAAMALIEPLILIVMAVFVGGVLISLYLPIFTLGVQGAH